VVSWPTADAALATSPIIDVAVGEYLLLWLRRSADASIRDAAHQADAPASQ
jgi:hypothetical protein